MIKLASKAKSYKKPANDEHRIQCACVKWFRLEYPKLKDMLFAVPNAARRSARNGAYMKDEGMLPGRCRFNPFKKQPLLWSFVCGNEKAW